LTWLRKSSQTPALRNITLETGTQYRYQPVGACGGALLAKLIVWQCKSLFFAVGAVAGKECCLVADDALSAILRSYVP